MEGRTEPILMLRIVERRELEMGHARALLGLPQRRQQIEVGGLVAKKGLSVRDTENMVRSMLAKAGGGSASARDSGKGLDPNVQRLQDELSEKLGAPTGAIMNSCRSVPCQLACTPPFRMLNIGTGRRQAVEPPRYRKSGRWQSCAAARATARLTPRIALAPSLDLFGAPSSRSMVRSTAPWSSASIPRSALAISLLTLATGAVTPAATPTVTPPTGTTTTAASPSAAPVETAVAANLRPRPAPLPAAPSGPATPREACGSRVLIALWNCIEHECRKPRYAQQAECVRLAEERRKREYP